MQGSTAEPDGATVNANRRATKIAFRILRSERSIRKSVLGVAGIAAPRSPAGLARVAANIVMLSQFYYLFVAYMIGASRLGFDVAYMGGPPTTPLWPIKMVQKFTGGDWLSHGTAVTAAGLLLAISAAIVPRVFVLRLGTFLYLLLQVALRNSYGSINHSAYVLLYISVALLFLPRRTAGQRMTRENVLSCLVVLPLIQTAVLLPYALSGFWKIWYGRLELFSPDALTRILLERLLAEVDDIPPLLTFVSQHSRLAQTMWFLAIYIEISALLVVFRPHLHRPFGIIFILFHVTSDWMMNITFSNHIIVLGIFLVLSPLAPARFSVSGFTQSLPIIGFPFRAMRRLRSLDESQGFRRVWLVYDGECPLCRNYAQFLDLKRSVKEVTLVDARQGGPIVEDIRNLPHNLNEGMVVKVNGRYYIGHEALNVLALLSENRGFFNSINRLVFNSPLAARLGYPWLKLGRWLLLKLKGVAPIGHEG